MLINKYKGEDLDENIKKFYTDLSDKFIKKDYSYIDEKYMGKYRLSKEIIVKMYPNVDFDYLVYTQEGQEDQDELVLNYHIDKLFKEIEDIVKKYVNEKFYIEESMQYHQNYKNISWEKLEEKIKKTDFKDIKDLRKKSIKISLAALIASFHIFGLKKVKEFLEEKKYICIDGNNIPITFYFEYFKNYDISNFFEIKDEKVVLENKNPEEKKYIDGLKEEEKEIFEGQKSEEKLEKIVNKINDLKLLEKILQILKQKNKENSNKTNDLVEDLKNQYEKSNKKEKYFENEDLDKNRTKDNKYLVKKNEKVDKILKDKYEREYKNNPSKYIEDTTNRKIDKKEKEDIDEILNEYNKENDNFIKQKKFDEFRDINKLNDKIAIEDILLYLLEENQGKELEKIERYLSKYSCRYIKESFLKKSKNFLKNLFLSKVSKYTNRNLRSIGVDYKFKFEDYNYLEFGKKDIDDLNVKGKKELLDYIKIKQLVKESYALDKNGVRKYPRFRRVLDNVLIKYICNQIKLKNEYFDGVNVKDKNIVRKSIIELDFKVLGMNSKHYEIYFNIGKELSITSLIIYFLKNNIENQLEYIDSNLNDIEYETYVRNLNYQNDKSKILQIFPTIESIREHCKIKNVNNIAFFYNKFYEYQKGKSNDVDTIAGINSILTCTLGIGTSKILNSISNISIDNNTIVTDNDKNIKPFESCSVCKVCVPNLITNWQNVSNIKIKNSNALLVSSYITCSYGGIIKLNDFTQKKLKKSLIENSNIEKKEVLKKSPYKSVDDLKKFISKEVVFYIYANVVYRFYSNKNQYKEKINDSFKFLEDKIATELKYNFDDADSKFKLAVYSEKEGRVYNIEKILEFIKDKFLTKNLLVNPIEASKITDDFLKQTDFKNKKYISNKNLDSKPIWLNIVMDEYEKYKNKDFNYLKNKIVEYHKIGGGIDASEKTPWCASFANYCLNLSGVSNFKIPSSQEMKNNLKKIDTPLIGSVVIFTRYDKNDQKTNFGHVSFLFSISENKKYYICLGGNQQRKIKYSKYNINGKIAIRDGYLKLDGIYWPSNYPIENIERL